LGIIDVNGEGIEDIEDNKGEERKNIPDRLKLRD